MATDSNELRGIASGLLPAIAPHTGIPLSRTYPIRWRQIFRAAIARFFRSTSHASVVLGDAGLMLFSQWDDFGILQIPIIHFIMVTLLVYEGVFIACDLFYQTLYYRMYFFDIREEGIIIRRGVLCRQELTLPLTSVVDVYLDQDFYARVLGLYDLHISSPTKHSGKFAHMIGIDRRGALTIRQMILDRIGRANLKKELGPSVTEANANR